MKASLQKALYLSGILMLLTQLGRAQTTVTYTAVANGNYTSASTWQGGIKPPVTTGLINQQKDLIVIPQGITVVLDTNLVLKNGPGYGQLTVEGTINGQAERYISAGNIVSNTGSIIVDSIDLWGLYPTANGTITANKCRMQNYSTAGPINIKKRLYLPHTNTTMINGPLNFDNHCWIDYTGYSSFIVQNAGVINYADTMNVFRGDLAKIPSPIRWNVDIDTALFDRQIDTMIIDLAQGNAPTAKTWTYSIAHKDLYFNGVMILRSGNLKLNQHKLTLGTHAKIFYNPLTGRIAADKNAVVAVNANNNLGEGLYFYPGAPTHNVNAEDTLRNLTINMGSNTSSVLLHGELTIANNLDLVKGLLHLVDSSNLIINTSATISNAGTNSFITNDFGTSTHMSIHSNATATFPVGTGILTRYAPVDVKNNSSSMEIYKVGCTAGVQDTIDRGFDISFEEPCVAATWWVDPSAATGSNADVTLKWPVALEYNNFNRAQSYITRYLYNQLHWDTLPTHSMANTQGSLYTQTETINNFSTTKGNYFSVFDGATSLANLSVNNLTTNNKVTLYPNPTYGNATLSITLEKTQSIAITLTDVNGRVVYTQPVTEYNNGQHNIALPTQNLTNGLYFLQLTNEKGTLLNSGKLMKQ
ncbi:MAG: T9SS type A sorting domain-containing protein [Flavipsychrobacter sp.]